MSAIDIAAIRARAEAADATDAWVTTPEWDETGRALVHSKKGWLVCLIYAGGLRDQFMAHIAGMDPPTTLALLDELAASQAREEALRRALEPFARLQREVDRLYPDYADHIVVVGWGKASLTHGHLRAARAALTTPGDTGLGAQQGDS